MKGGKMAKRPNIILSRDDIVDLCKKNEKPIEVEMNITGYGCGYAISLVIIGKFEERSDSIHRVFGILYSSDTKPNKGNNGFFNLSYDIDTNKLKLVPVKRDFEFLEGGSDMTQQTLKDNVFILAPTDRTTDFANSVVR